MSSVETGQGYSGIVSLARERGVGVDQQASLLRAMGLAQLPLARQSQERVLGGANEELNEFNSLLFLV